MRIADRSKRDRAKDLVQAGFDLKRFLRNLK